MSFIETYWREILIVFFAGATIVEAYFILRRKRRRKQLDPLIIDIRKTLREQHVKQKKLFGDIDYLLSEIPEFVAQNERRIRREA